MNAGNFLSPEALIVLPLAVTLDLVGIVLIIFALDDFFITDAVGWATLGVWSAFRSQLKESGSAIEIPDTKERNEQAKMVKTSKTTTATKASKWAKWIRFLEFVPYLGALPFWTISTFLILKED